MARAYPAEFRAKALALYEKNGLSAAHRKFGVSRTTVRKWAIAAGIDTSLGSTPNVEKATMAVREKRLKLRSGLLDKLSDLLAAIDPAAPRDCRDLGWTFGVLLDKYRLENGESTSRSEHLSLDQVEQELQRIIAGG